MTLAHPMLPFRGMKPLPKILLALTAVAAFSLAHPASVQAVPITYQYTGNPFTFVTPGGPYTTTMFVSAMITLATPLGPNFSGSVSPTAFTLFDGVQTITNGNSIGSTFILATGPSGLPTTWTIIVSVLGGSIFTENEAFIVQDAGGITAPFPGFVGLVRDNPGTWTIVGQVPDTGSTLSLMTLTLMALGLVARRFQRAAG